MGNRCPYLVIKLRQKGKTQIRGNDPDAIKICITCPFAGEGECWDDLTYGRQKKFKAEIEKLYKDMKIVKEKLDENNAD